MSVRPYLVLALLFWSCATQALEIKPFATSYKVFRANSYIADSQFSFKKSQGEWIWRMDTRARGIYKWFTRKRPYIETRMQEIDHELKLMMELSGDYPDKMPKRSSWFDPVNKVIYYMKGDHIKTFKLPEKIYNFHSIHLLYPRMKQQGMDEISIDFFKKGELLKSTLTLQQSVELKNKNKPLRVDKVIHRFEGSNKYFIYYYHGDTLAPLKIEQINPGKESSVMWRQD